MIFDQYTLLHIASGISAYFWNISLKNWIILHTIFEITENTNIGMKIINKYIKIWPGGKEKRDSLENSLIGDTTGAIIGWYMAYYLDYIGTKRGWYEGHLVSN